MVQVLVKLNGQGRVGLVTVNNVQGYLHPTWLPTELGLTATRCAKRGCYFHYLYFDEPKSHYQLVERGLLYAHISTERNAWQQ